MAVVETREEWVGMGVFRENMDRIGRWMGGMRMT